MTSLPPNFSINLAGSFGVCLGTTLIAVALWGANIVQAFIFYTRSRADPLATRVLVAWLLTCETTRLGIIVKGLFRPLILEWGDAARLAVNIQEFEWQNIPYALITAPSQVFFMYRIYKLAQRPLWMAIPTAAAILGQLIGSGLYIGLTIHNRLTQEVVEDKAGTIIIWLIVALSLAVDLFIAAYLTGYVLLKKSGLAQTESMVNRLIFFSITTGLWTALLALGIMITMVVAPNSLIFLGLQFLSSGFYITSVLANLNARGWVRGESNVISGRASVLFKSTQESTSRSELRTSIRSHPRSDSLNFSKQLQIKGWPMSTSVASGGTHSIADGVRH